MVCVVVNLPPVKNIHEMVPIWRADFRQEPSATVCVSVRVEIFKVGNKAGDMVL